MSRVKQSPSRKRFKKAVPVLGAAAGLSLSLASGASAGPAPHMPTPRAERVTKSFWLRRKSQTLAWRRFSSTTKKTPHHSVPMFSSPEADVVVAVAVAGAEGAVAGGAAVAGVEVALAAEVAMGVPAFGPTGAAEAARCALDVHKSGGVSRRRLQCISIRRRRAGHQ